MYNQNKPNPHLLCVSVFIKMKKKAGGGGKANLQLVCGG